MSATRTAWRARPSGAMERVPDPDQIDAVALREELGLDPDAYRSDYNRGWRYSARGSGGLDHADATGLSAREGWMDGYLDYAAGRSKWHLRDCTDHTAAGSGHGCEEA